MLKTSTFESALGLTLELHSEVNIYTLYEVPIKIYINSQSINKDAAEMIMASVGMETNIAISSFQRKKLGKPYSNCQQEVLIRNISTGLSNSYMYNNKNCLDLNFLSNLAERFNKSAQFVKIRDLYYTNNMQFNELFYEDIVLTYDGDTFNQDFDSL